LQLVTVTETEATRSMLPAWPATVNVPWVPALDAGTMNRSDCGEPYVRT
jgi:hypothetical protein